MMQRIEAVLNPEKLYEVRAALSEIGVFGMTVVEARGGGREPGYYETYKGIQYFVDLMPKVKVEVIVTDEQVEACIQCICTAARTGRIGDGKIVVTPVTRIIRIRTGEEGLDAL